MTEWPIRDLRLCRFPIGSPTDQDFKWCEAIADNQNPYCESHMKICYQKMSRRSVENA